jgi:hypothetical protein
MVHRLTRSCLVLALFLLLVTGQTLQREEYKYAVRGRVIDDSGQPVARAYVVVDAGPGGDVIIYTEADAEGRFCFEERDTLAKHERTLYTTTPQFPRAYDVVHPPFDRYPSLTGQPYAGQKISIKKNGEIDVGDVRVQVYYGIIDLVLRSYKDAPLSAAEKRKWREPWLRIRNVRDEIIIESSFPTDIVDKAVAVALPEGTWRIEVSPDFNKRRWFALDNPVVVRRLSSPQQVVFKVPWRTD